MPSIRLIGKYFEPLLWLLIIPVLISGLGTQLLINVLPHTPTDTWPELKAALQQAFHASGGQTGLWLIALGYVWMFVTYPATIVLAHRAVRGEPADSLLCLRLSRHYFVRLYIVTIVTTLAIVAGLILFIIPGLFLLRRYILIPYELVATDSRPTEALQRIGPRTKPYRIYIWGLLAVIVIISLVASGLGQVPLFGFALSIAVNYLYFFAPALRYREIYEANPDAVKI